MQGAASAQELKGEASTTVRLLGSRTYVLSDGKWIDTAFDPDKMQPMKVDFLSEEYFSLVAAHPNLADAFALGEVVIALSEGVAYEVVPSDAPAQLPDMTPTPGDINPDTSTSTPNAPRTPAPTSPATPDKPTGVCGAVLLPIAFVPLFVMFVKRPRRIG
jgi:hypothetical protein